MIAKEKLNILWSLEQTAEKYADRVAVSDVNQELTWKELVKKAQVIGAELSKKVQPGNPIPVLLEKSSETLAVMLGIVYAGCFYVPVNPMNPTERLRNGIYWWDYCGSIFVNSYPTYFEKLPPLVAKINKEKQNSKNYVLGRREYSGTLPESRAVPD